MSSLEGPGPQMRDDPQDFKKTTKQEGTQNTSLERTHEFYTTKIRLMSIDRRREDFKFKRGNP